MDSPLLSYIDVWHPNFLPPNLTVGEAWDLGPQLVKAYSLVPVRDEYANLVFQGRPIHTPVEEPRVEVQPADQVEVESVNSSSAEAKNAEDEMVVWQNMTIN